MSPPPQLTLNEYPFSKFCNPRFILRYVYFVEFMSRTISESKNHSKSLDIRLFQNCPQKQTKPLSAMYGEIIQGSENKTPSRGVQLNSFDFSSILLLH